MKPSIELSQHFADVIKHLEKYNPDDACPAATRSTLAYMRILESEGSNELVQALNANIAAGIAVLSVLAPTPQEALLAYSELTVRVVQEIRAGLVTITKGTPK